MKMIFVVGVVSRPQYSCEIVATVGADALQKALLPDFPEGFFLHNDLLAIIKGNLCDVDSQASAVLG